MMTSEDILLPSNDDWVALVLTGTVIHIVEVEGSALWFRFGISSTSKGAKLDVGESLSVDETIYVKPLNKARNDVFITVTKD